MIYGKEELTELLRQKYESAKEKMDTKINDFTCGKIPYTDEEDELEELLRLSNKVNSLDTIIKYVEE